MADNHIVNVRYHKNGFFMTRAVFQYDYGQVLKLEDFPDLPDAFEMHFAKKGSDESVTQIGLDGEVAIPDALLVESGTVSCWLYLHDSMADGETRYSIDIPVTQRASITDSEPTPVQQGTIEQLMTSFGAVADRCEEALDDIREMDASAVTLPSGAEATAEYSDRHLTIGVPIGPKGEKGEKGDKGDPGIQGPRGPQGVQGPKGEKGEKGDKGATGVQGPQGKQGLQGPRGLKGEDGAPGAKGDKGDKGDRGEKGEKGDPGSNAINDNAGSGYTSSLWSANKLTNEFAKVAVLQGTGSGSAKTRNFSYRSGTSTITVVNTASGVGSLAEGYSTTAEGMASHAEGTGTIASGESQHVSGRYNQADSNDNYAEIVGNGQSNLQRSNAYTLDWDGNAHYAGKVSSGTAANPAPVENDHDLVTKKYADDLVDGIAEEVTDAVRDEIASDLADISPKVTVTGGVMTAASLIESGEFFMADDKLYRASTDISAGATVTTGTNCVKIGLAEALNIVRTLGAVLG